MILTTSSKFKRSFRRLVKKNPPLQDKIVALMAELITQRSEAAVLEREIKTQLTKVGFEL